MLKKKKYQIYPINPKIDLFDGDKYYQDLYSLPEPVDGVLIVTNLHLAEQLVQQCITSKIYRMYVSQEFLL
jgi:predicted CoA-binding protein